MPDRRRNSDGSRGGCLLSRAWEKLVCRLTRSRWPNLNWGSPATKQPLKQAGPRAKHRALRWPIDATITCGAWLFQAPALQSTPPPVPAATRAASPAAAIGATAAQDAVMFAGCQPPGLLSISSCSARDAGVRKLRRKALRFCQSLLPSRAHFILLLLHA